MAVNITECTWEAKQLRPRTDAYRALNLTMFGVVYFLLATCSIAWFANRKHPYLARRSFSLVFIAITGVAMMQITGSLNRGAPDVLTCNVDLFLYMTALPTTAWPLGVRLILWANRVRFNFAIAKEIGTNEFFTMKLMECMLATKGLPELDTAADALSRDRFRASRRFGLLLVACGLVPLYIMSTIVVYFDLCRCSNYNSRLFLYFVAIAAIVVALSLGIVYRFRDVPDVIHLRRETIQTFLSSSIIAMTAFVLQFLDVGGFKEQDPQAFDWAIMIDVGMASGFFFTMPLQIIRSYRTSQTSKGRLDKLHHVLGSDRGAQIFQLYLATELSIENLLFYKSISEWKKAYRSPQSARLSALKIADTYLKPGRDLEVNVGYDIRLRLEERLESDRGSINEQIFDELSDEIFKLMANDSYENFKKSDFYRLYIGEISPEELTYIQSTGVSSYAKLSSEDSLLLPSETI